MQENHAARRFRAILHARNELTTFKDRRSRAKKAALGEAAEVGLRLQEKETKGRPKQEEQPQRQPPKR